MATKREYTIPFEGLKEGIHNFEFNLGKEFIDRNKIEDIKSLSAKVYLKINKKLRILTVDIKMEGEIKTICDRCIEKLTLPISYSNRFYVKTGIDKESDAEDEDDILYVKNEENDIDLEQYIYESVVLSIPLKKVHPDDQDGMPSCNSEVMRILYRNNKKNKKNKPSDPRWDALKGLK